MTVLLQFLTPALCLSTSVFDLSLLHRGQWRERGCTAGYVSFSFFIDAYCFTEDLIV